MRVIIAPDAYEIKGDDVTCFLAGGITNCKDWQTDIIDMLRSYESVGIDLSHLVLFNPRRKVFDMSSIADSVDQITWEYTAIQRSAIFSVFFAHSSSVQPITLYELGYNLDRKSRIIITAENGYKRLLDVKMQVALATDEQQPVTVGTVFDHAAAIVRRYKTLLEEDGE
jgi:hypothetical protein